MISSVFSSAPEQSPAKSARGDASRSINSNLNRSARERTERVCHRADRRRHAQFRRGQIGPEFAVRAPRPSSAHLLNCRFAMAISKELLEILVCPICKAVVELKPDKAG